MLELQLQLQLELDEASSAMYMFRTAEGNWVCASSPEEPGNEEWWATLASDAVAKTRWQYPDDATHASEDQRSPVGQTWVVVGTTGEVQLAALPEPKPEREEERSAKKQKIDGEWSGGVVW